MEMKLPAGEAAARRLRVFVSGVRSSSSELASSPVEEKVVAATVFPCAEAIKRNRDVRGGVNLNRY